MKSLRIRRKSFVEPPFWSLERATWATPGLTNREPIDHDFIAYVQQAYKANGVIFACMLTRQLIFSEARFLWRERFDSGRFSKPFGAPSASGAPGLALLDRPWPNGATGDLLVRMEQDSSLAGNFYGVVVDDQGRMGRAARGPKYRVARLRPDWVIIVLGSRSGDITAPDTTVIAYRYQSPLMSEPVIFLPSEVCHYAPIPDPTANWRGMSWLTPTVREIEADQAATRHKLKFFEKGATLSNVFTLDKDVTPEAFREFVRLFKEQHEGVDAAYKTLFLGGGADATLTGTNLQQLDFKVTQGAGETRIAADSGVHPVIVGLSEGLAGSSLNAGNFNSARRLVADRTFRPLWRIAASSLDTLVKPPRETVRLYPDLSEVAFLREDAKDVADIQSTQAQAMRQLTDAGFEPDTIVLALQTNDWSRLVHSGLFSVQLQPPGTGAVDANGQQITGQPATTQEGNRNGSAQNGVARVGQVG